VIRLCGVAVLSVIFVGTLSAQTQLQTSASDSAAVTAVQAALKSRVEVWNRGDLEGVMAGYWHSKQLTFISNSEETRGWERVVNRFREIYQYGGNQMGKLGISYVEPIHLLGQDTAYADGKWQRTMPDGKTLHGTFTLIFRKFSEGWLIVHEQMCTE
jgi:ketosteroid isomerase-like protein